MVRPPLIGSRILHRWGQATLDCSPVRSATRTPFYLDAHSTKESRNPRYSPDRGGQGSSRNSAVCRCRPKLLVLYVYRNKSYVWKTRARHVSAPGQTIHTHGSSFGDIFEIKRHLNYSLNVQRVARVSIGDSLTYAVSLVLASRCRRTHRKRSGASNFVSLKVSRLSKKQT